MPGPYSGYALNYPPGAGWRDLTVTAASAGVGAAAPTIGAMTADIHYEVGQIATYNRARGTGWVP